MRYISIDVETTGLDPIKNQLLEVGAVLEDTMVDCPIDELSTFRALIPHDSYFINSYCMRLHVELFKELDDAAEKLGSSNLWCVNDSLYYCKPEMLEDCFQAWLASDDKITAAGKNFYGFDHKFITPWLPNIKFRHRALDPVMYYIRKEDEEPPNLATCCQRAGIELKNHHTAVGDAKTVIELIRKGQRD